MTKAHFEPRREPAVIHVAQARTAVVTGAGSGIGRAVARQLLDAGFAGIAFHVTPALDRFESVYLRPTNGTLTNPGSPRDQRGIQYFAYPDWPFDRLREEHPAGTYEAAAPITPGRWFRLSVNVAPDRITTSINDTEVLHIQTPLAPPSLGAVGLFVDIGTDAHFADLTVTHSNHVGD